MIRGLPAGVVSACTDVTGFGLIGHGSEMAAASGVTLAFEADELPVLEGALVLAVANTPGGNRTNVAHFGPRATIGRGVSEALRLVAFDPQTSGGLLVAVDPEATGHLLGRLAACDVVARVIGRVEPRDPGGILTRLS